MEANYDVMCVQIKKVVLLALQSKSVALIQSTNKQVHCTDKDVKAIYDQAFREVLLDLMKDHSSVKRLQDLVSLSIEASRLELVTLSNPVTLLGDIFDLLTLERCLEMFYFVEQNVNVWKEEMFFSSCKNILLRMCNDLLRKVSKSSCTIFCGRILLFLAKFFPFSERSGLNIVSEFNLDNLTEFGGERNGFEEETVFVHAQNDKIPIDYNLYCKFWSLQDYFRNPNQCYDKMHWKVFCANSSSIISTFQGLKLEHLGEDNEDDVIVESRLQKMYFTKYLTSKKLLDLQMYDVNFRRFVLLQFLILFQYLTMTVRFKPSYELTGDQKALIQSMTEIVHKLLRETPPDGEIFDQIVTKILLREEHWNSWKNEGCPEFRKALLPTHSSGGEPALVPPRNRTHVGNLIRAAREKGEFYMENGELTKLWNLHPDNLGSCKTKERDFLPQLDGYFGDIIEQMEYGEAGQHYALLKDGNFGWRALRLLARRSPYFFQHSNKPISELPGYLELMIIRLAAERNSLIKQEYVDESNEVEDLFKDDAQEDVGDADGEFHVQNIIPFRVTVLTRTQLLQIGKALAIDWQLFARKVGYKADEIEYIVAHNSDPLAQALNLLNIWFEEDDDSTLENFLYILEGLGLSEPADEVRIAMEQNKNLKTEITSCTEND